MGQGSDYNGSALRSNDGPDQSIAQIDEVVNRQEVPVSPSKMTLKHLEPIELSKDKIQSTLTTIGKKAQIGDKVNSMDLLFGTIARIVGEGSLVLRIQTLLRGINKILEGNTAEFVIFNTDTRMLFLEMLPE